MASDALSLPPPNEAPEAARRQALFQETLADRARRVVLGTAWALKPPRHRSLPRLLRLWLADMVTSGTVLPAPDAAGDDPEGLCGIARDLAPATLIAAYRRGLYPLGHAGPQKWRSPPQRCILHFRDFHMSRRLRSRLRQQRHNVTFDRDFAGVIAACAAPRGGKLPLTWITPQMMRAYAALHDAGYAHSFEVTDAAGELVGGGYGVAVGGCFVIESQFARESGASKIGFSVLNWHLARWGFTLSDNKVPSQNVLEMGFHTVPRAQFLAQFAESQRLGDRPGRWQTETDLATVAAWEPDR